MNQTCHCALFPSKSYINPRIFVHFLRTPKLMNQTTGDPKSPHLSLMTLDLSVALNNTFITLVFPLRSDKSLSNTRQREFVSRVTCTKPIMFVFYSVERMRLIEPAALSAPGCCYSHCNEVVGQPVTFACLWMLASMHPWMTPLLPVAGHGSPHSAPSGGSKGPGHVTQWLIGGVIEVRSVKLGSRISSDDKCMSVSGHKTQRVIWDFRWQSAHREGIDAQNGILTV